jgi:UPF0148 protein
MVDMLKQGATLSQLACPACASPLFRVQSGDLWCAKCNKQVIVVKEGETPSMGDDQIHITRLEQTMITKIQAIEKQINDVDDIEELQKLNMVLASLLENLQRLKKMKKG